MGYEVDFLNVGEKQSSGDAIAIRFGDLINNGEQRVIVIDGGTKKSGEELVAHIKNYYGTDTIDLVISTHSDQDHISGLSVILEQMKVKELWMHKPWDHSSEVVDIIEDGRVTDNSIELRIRESLEMAYSIHELAVEKKIPVYEPFSGKTYSDTILQGNLTVLSPNKEFYQELIPEFRLFKSTKGAGTISQLISSAVEKVKTYLEDTWDIETLDDEDTTSAENNSSVVLLAKFEEVTFLFTADAGIQALTNANNYATANGIDLKEVKSIQIPHHGSKRNVGPTILNNIIGDVIQSDNPTKRGYVSASKGGNSKHPSQITINAFRRRGVKIFSTQGKKLTSYDDAPEREGWTSATPLPFSDVKIEED